MHRVDQVSVLHTNSMLYARPKPHQTPSMPISQGLISAKENTHQHRHFVFADPVAFRYLEEDTATTVVERRGRLQGYELYLVEQWATSRVDPTFVITTYTGDPNHAVLVGVLGIPADEGLWSPRLRLYFKAISKYHARPRETPLGMLMVTNLSSFPSALTVIRVPDGDVRKHREDFIVNENLKRLGCSGRSGMSLSQPAGATQAKFQELYKSSDLISLYGAVLELVKLCQVALMLFGKLEQEYADGLLCDVTEKAINDWWTEIGSEYYVIEPTDGILGPTTVAALLGLLLGARNRLNYFGAPVAKDAFDVFALKRGIAYFQKSQKLEKTRRLDRHTLNRLHHVTAKAAAGEGWAVPKAVKSTVAELSGKGGEMMMGMVGREKAGIGDIETLDIDQFINLVHGERSKWLWYGKPRRAGGSDNFGRSDTENGTLSFNKDDQGGFIWSNNRTDTFPFDDDAEVCKKEGDFPVYGHQPPGSATSLTESPNDRELRKMVFKSVTGRMNDARSGFERFKDAVGFRGHVSRPSKDDTGEFCPQMGARFSPTAGTLSPSIGVPSSPQMVQKAFSWKTKPEDYHAGYPKFRDAISNSVSSALGHLHDSYSPKDDSKTSLALQHSPQAEDDRKNAEAEAEAQWAAQVKDIRSGLVEKDPSIGSQCDDGDLEGPLLEAEREVHNFQVLLQRRHSISIDPRLEARRCNEAWWPRHMSFSDAEEAVLTWEPIDNLNDDQAQTDNWVQLQNQNYLTEDLKRLYGKVRILLDEIGPWVESKVDAIEVLDGQASLDQERLQACFYEQRSSYQSTKQQAQDTLGDERSHVTEAIKDIEVLGAKLEYEINSLVSKVHDVEDGVTQFERHVDNLEARAAELEEQFNSESWTHWFVRSITGVGTAPMNT